MAAISNGTRQKRDPRRWIYVSLDVIFAALYAAVVFGIAHNRLPLGRLHLYALPVVTFTLAIGTAVGSKWGWRLAVTSAGVLLALAILLIVRLVVSAAFLAGVYGAFGQSAAGGAMIGAALVIEVVGLLPLFQLKYLRTAAGRRALRA